MNISIFMIIAAVAAVFGAIMICDLRANQPTRSTDATEEPPSAEPPSAEPPSAEPPSAEPPSAEPPEDISGHPRSLKHALADLREKFARISECHRDRSQLARMICQLEAELEDRDKPGG